MKLSERLESLGFQKVFGTNSVDRERIKGCESYSTDTYRRKGVVYDEVGQPWIISSAEYSDVIRILNSEYPLKRGAFVPGSGDEREIAIPADSRKAAREIIVEVMTHSSAEYAKRRSLIQGIERIQRNKKEILLIESQMSGEGDNMLRL